MVKAMRPAVLIRALLTEKRVEADAPLPTGPHASADAPAEGIGGGPAQAAAGATADAVAATAAEAGP